MIPCVEIIQRLCEIKAHITAYGLDFVEYIQMIAEPDLETLWNIYRYIEIKELPRKDHITQLLSLSVE
jgi:hypothetical protein